jgi:plastocyanin
MTSSRCFTLLAAVALSLAVAPAAHAATKTVYMGLPPKDLAKFNQPYGTDAVAFFPNTITIVAGDSISFSAVAFHNVDIPAKGQKMLDQLRKGPNITGLKDAAGNPFWFSDVGFPSFSFDPSLQSGGLGKHLTYTGTKRILSKIPLDQAHPFSKLKPMVVKFPKAGSFTYYCDLHPGMQGTVKVLAKGKKAPTAKADAKALAKQVAAAFKIAKTLRDTPVPANTIDVGMAGNGVEYFNFLPNTLTVPVGTTVTFQMSPKSFETHTATTGPGDYLTDPTSYIGAIADSFNFPQFDQRGVYPSDSPLLPPAQLTPTSHGNGFWNSGALDNQSATPSPNSAKVTFSAPGTYKFACLIHPVMRGTVIVQ